MKSLELKPTYENLLDTYLKDTLGRNKDIALFAEILNSIDDSCSIAIDGAWGSGKTFFTKQVKMFLDSHNPNTKFMSEDDKSVFCTERTQDKYEPQVNVYYDAWENDNDSDPVLSLVYSIIQCVDTDFDFKENTGIIKKAASILEFFSNKNWNALIESFKSNDPLDEIRKAKDIEKLISEFLDGLLIERGNRLTIFIDELDRCRPDYAVKLLERIKHYFSNDRITFVFSVNIKELQHTIKTFYGNDFDACRYLDRFFDLRITLPPADLSKYYKSIDFDVNQYTVDSLCGDIIKNYNFSLREIAKYLRLIKIAAYSPTHQSNEYDFSFPEGRAKQLCILYIVPIMIALNVYERDLYEDFISGKNSKPLIDNLSNYLYNFEKLLERDESYDLEEGKTKVTLAEKLDKVYDALFNTTYTGEMYQRKIGDYSFEERTKNTLMEVVSLLSKYTTLEFNDTQR